MSGFGARLTTCKCGHPAVEHYDSHDICTKYRDENTGFEGVATAVYFFQYGCTRVMIVGLVRGEVKEFVFDEQGLIKVETDKKVKTASPAGGPHPGPQGTGLRAQRPGAPERH